MAKDKYSTIHHLLRNILRRKQCFMILLIQLSILALLIFLTLVLFYFNAKLNAKYLRLNRENEILAEYANFTSFFSCKYYKPSEYDVSECGWASDESAFMVRHYRKRTNIHKCASRLDMIPCDLKYPPSYKHWQNLLRKILNQTDLISQYRPCPGLFNNSIGDYGISPQTTILAPKIKNINQFSREFMLRPKDFIMRCPMCMISSRFSSMVNKFADREMRKNYCVRSVKTLREGWPQYAALCDEVEHHPYVEFCNTYDAVMNKIRDTTAPVIDGEVDYDADID